MRWCVCWLSSFLCARSLEEGLLPKQIHYFFEHYFKVSDPPARLKADENTIVSSSLAGVGRARNHLCSSQPPHCLTNFIGLCMYVCATCLGIVLCKKSHFLHKCMQACMLMMMSLLSGQAWLTLLKRGCLGGVEGGGPEMIM